MSMKQKAFTLIELSIVLVIIGLIVGGVLVGQTLIEQSKIRQTVSQNQEYTTAVNAFKLKYNCLPGDCANAYDFFDTACGNNANLCNGTGDRKWSGGPGSATDLPDGKKAWTHLSLANMVDGQWRISDLNATIPGVTRPATALGDDGMWTFVNMDHIQGSLRLSGPRPSPSPHSSGLWAGITGERAYALDVKLDDGLPSSGRVIGRNTLSTSQCLSGGEYNITRTDIQCLMYFNNF